MKEKTKINNKKKKEEKGKKFCKYSYYKRYKYKNVRHKKWIRLPNESFLLFVRNFDR